MIRFITASALKALSPELRSRYSIRSLLRNSRDAVCSPSSAVVILCMLQYSNSRRSNVEDTLLPVEGPGGARDSDQGGTICC